MKIALDPYMLRTTPLPELPALVAELGYQHIELSPREDFIPFYRHPRASDSDVRAFKAALRAADVQVATILPLFRWAGPGEDARQAAVRYWRRSIQIAADLEVPEMLSEFNGGPAEPAECEALFWRSMEDLLPDFEREGIRLVIEPHPNDFIEDGFASVDIIRGINHPLVSFSYCAPHTFYMGGDIEGIMRYAGGLLTHVHVADTFDFRASSGLRYIVNAGAGGGVPAGMTPPRIHQHLDIGQGEVDWDLFFGTLKDLQFDGVMTVCVFAWEERAEESSRYNLAQIQSRMS